MKKIIILTFFCFFIFSCYKSEEKSSSSGVVDSNISSIGDISLKYSSSEVVNNRISKNGEYLQYLNEKLGYSFLFKGSDNFSFQEVTLDNPEFKITNLKKNSLTISIDTFDGPLSKYIVLNVKDLKEILKIDNISSEKINISGFNGTKLSYYINNNHTEQFIIKGKKSNLFILTKTVFSKDPDNGFDELIKSFKIL